ncbi:MAG TPA: peptidoglycan-binding protein [Waterburya sp.]|jgi:peptidoglycan hydrolase-like protein with peptidoglycan-binding domain
METLAYLHLALANEAPTDINYRDLTATWESLKQYTQGAVHQLWNQPKLSTRAAVSLLSLTIALSVFGVANQALAVVQEGDQGADVTAVQQRLRELGYYKAKINGYFSSQTKDAVIQFQEAKGLAPDGIVGPNTLAALDRQRQTKTRPVQQTSVRSEPESAARILQLGDRGSQVSALQESLAAAGFPANTNGIFDAATQRAVIRFQQAKSLTVDGIVGPQTLAALPAVGGSNPASTLRRTASRRSTRPTASTNLNAPRTTAERSTSRTTSTRSIRQTPSTNLKPPRTTAERSTSRTTSTRSIRQTPSTNLKPPKTTVSSSTSTTPISQLNKPKPTLSPSNIEALQKRLQELGFYRGEIDGIWGPQTQAAVEAAQRAYSIGTADVDNGRL